jgi:hypothetical protein
MGEVNSPQFPVQCMDLRHNSALPPGKCVYIQSGDPGDFDGEFALVLAVIAWVKVTFALIPP